MNIIAWLILGAIAGYLAGFLVRGDEGLGVIGHIVLGIVGALVGGFLATVLFNVNPVDGAFVSSVVITARRVRGPRWRAVRYRTGPAPRDAAECRSGPQRPAASFPQLGTRYRVCEASAARPRERGEMPVGSPPRGCPARHQEAQPAARPPSGERGRRRSRPRRLRGRATRPKQRPTGGRSQRGSSWAASAGRSCAPPSPGPRKRRCRRRGATRAPTRGGLQPLRLPVGRARIGAAPRGLKPPRAPPSSRAGARFRSTRSSADCRITHRLRWRA